jgi:hypothetical protein
MPTFKNLIKQTGNLLDGHPVGKSLLELWKSVEWQEMAEDHGKSEAALSPTNNALIRLFPSLLKNPKAGWIVLREFGDFVLAKSGSHGRSIWQKKLSIPTEEQIDAFALKLADPEVRKTCQTYEQLVSGYPSKGHAVDRLVAVHFSNALMANNLPFRDSQGVDIKHWGPTAEFASRKRYHSLIPLTSAYCPKEVHESFGCAFAELVVSNLNCCRDKSVAYALKGTILNVVRRATG